MKEGDLIEDRSLGRGLIIYLEQGTPVVAFPLNPDLVLCDEGDLKFLIAIESI